MKKFLAALIAASALSTPALAMKVDVELVIVLDTSSSMDGQDYETQREHYSHTLMSQNILEVINGNFNQKIAIQLVEFAGQPRATEWVVVSSKKDMEQFVASIPHKNHSRSIWGQTNTGKALQLAVEGIDSNGIDSNQKVINLSTDAVPDDTVTVSNVVENLKNRSDHTWSINAQIVQTGGTEESLEKNAYEWISENVVFGSKAFVASEDYNNLESILVRNFQIEMF